MCVWVSVSRDADEYRFIRCTLPRLCKLCEVLYLLAVSYSIQPWLDFSGEKLVFRKALDTVSFATEAK